MTQHFAVSPRTLRLAALAVAATLVPFAAQADSRSAAANLFANMARAGVDVGVAPADAVVEPTLIRGMYSLYTRSGQLISYTNESGTLIGDSKGFNVLPSSGQQPRKLSPNERVELLAEFMAGVDYERLPRVSSGNGGERRLLMFSAIDCPTCQKFEAGLAKGMKEAPTTIYVVPASLQRGRHGAAEAQAWENVARIWCAQDSGQAWQKYWQNRSFPAPRACSINGATAERLVGGAMALFSAINIKVSGFPTMLREDGHLMTLTYGYDAGQAITMGRMGLVAPQQQPPKWLLADARISDAPDGGMGQQRGAQQQFGQPQQIGQPQQPGKISTGDLLKKLFK